MPCSGANSAKCGAGNLLSVFNVTTPSTPQVVGSFLSVTYLGCYATSISARVLNNYRVVATNMAPGVCAQICTGLGYAYAAVGLANECTCGQQLIAGAATSTACTAVSLILEKMTCIILLKFFAGVPEFPRAHLWRHECRLHVLHRRHRPSHI